MEEKTYIVYKITSKTTGKVYVGVTGCTLQSRWNRHLGDMRLQEKGLCKKRHFISALLKYGPDDFTKEIIDTGTSLEEVCKLEKFYIQKYDSYNRGYNSTLGGEGTEGHEVSEEQKAAMAARHKEKLKENPLFIRKATKETKNRASESHSKIVHTLVTIEGINYNSLRHAARELNSSIYRIKKYIEGELSLDDIVSKRKFKQRRRSYTVENLKFYDINEAAKFFMGAVDTIRSRIKVLRNNGVMKQFIEERIKKVGSKISYIILD